MKALMQKQTLEPKFEWPRKRSQSRYTWRHPDTGEPGLIVRPDKILFREFPKPFNHGGHGAGCPMCGGVRYNLGWHTDWDGTGKSKTGYWHKACAAAYALMSTPNEYSSFFYTRQDGFCSVTGEELIDGQYQIDHIIPLYRVYRDFGHIPVLELIEFWGPNNLRAITTEAHKDKNRYEARERAANK